MQKIKDRIKKFFRWIWGECKDYRTLLLLIGVMAVVYAPVWAGYLLYAIFRWRWCLAMATRMSDFLGGTVYAVLSFVHCRHAGNQTAPGEEAKKRCGRFCENRG